MHKTIIKPAAFLDRDGVINNDSNQYIKSPEDFKAVPGSIEAIKMLSEKGIPVAIATNQSGIGRGFLSYVTVCTIHQKLFDLLGKNDDAINYIAMCPHRPDQQCNCRKPKTGMLCEISDKLMIPLNKKVYFVGDSIKDAAIGPHISQASRDATTVAEHPLKHNARITLVGKWCRRRSPRRRIQIRTRVSILTVPYEKIGISRQLE